MTPARPPFRQVTQTRGHGSRTQPSGGGVTGHLLKIVRERLQSTQREFAEQLGVDTTTVQSWETGRRPLPAVSLAQFQTVRRLLLSQGADPELVVLLDVASQADAVIAYTMNSDSSSRRDMEAHPLAQWVFTRTATHLIAWALTGIPPTAMPPAPASPPRRRGPTPPSPLLAEPDRRVFFDRLRRYAEVADRAGDKWALLRRQAVYLCSYDRSPDTHAWLAHMRRPVWLTATSMSAWSDARSVATSLTRHGEQDVLWAFIDQCLSDDSGEVANLNYWAYWLGMDTLPRADDGFMASRTGTRWDAGALLHALADRLEPTLACLDLNVHSVWALLASHPGLPTADSHLASDLAGRVSRLLDLGVGSPRSRRELEQVHYGLRLSRTCFVERTPHERGTVRPGLGHLPHGDGSPQAREAQRVVDRGRQGSGDDR
ncbi:helix-turn-helix domain-containing protein [Streptomyces sp. URMC 129]|uniref:helix-turn-helix domain-containing protein n=1 Tax=Streptomyces sp. URMC 129 TaxID=3423407 RepID=UPI003F1BF479